MKIISFRSKITLSLTLLIVVTTYLSFQVLNKNLTEIVENKFYQNIKTALFFMRDNCFQLQEKHDIETVYPLLMSLAKNNDVSNVAFMNSEGKVTYSTKLQTLNPDSFMNIPPFKNDESVTLVSVNHSTVRAFMKINYSQEHKIHNEEVCDYIIVDYNLHELTDSLALIQKFGLVFTFFLLLIVFTAMILLHYRYVRGSLNKFKTTIKVVEEGNLDTRVLISRSDELGELAISFNQMLDRLQEMQAEIAEYHHRELTNSQKMATIGEMAAVVAHEIKNPLTGIANAMEIIVAEMPDSKKKPVLEEIQRQVRRVNKTMNALLQFSRPFDLQRKQGNINQIIERTVFFLENQINGKKINFYTKLDKNIPAFQFDPKQFEAVMINLGQNAIEAIENKGSIEVSTIFKKDEKELIFTIKDTGSGISDKDIDKILKPFFTTRNKGTGLGLSISKEIIEKHCGSLKIESKFGKGTTAIIVLPIECSNI